MEETFKSICSSIALGIEAAAVLIVLLGAAQAFWTILTLPFNAGVSQRRRKVWIGFGKWLVLGLEFQVAADVVRTSIAPSWNQIGQLAAIALIRTFLDYFLQRDLREEPADARPIVQ